MPTNSHDVTDPRILKNIKFHARRLASRGAVPGMTVEDYEQDLTADLIYRSRSFDPARASFFTFADRVVAHRASSLCKETLRKKAEREAVSLDAPIQNEGPDDVFNLHDILPDQKTCPADMELAIDFRRFLGELTPQEWQGCEILLAENVSEGAAAEGINRSTAYERIKQFRSKAVAHDLQQYVNGSDTCAASSVHGLEAEAIWASEPTPEAWMTRPQPGTPRQPMKKYDLERWMKIAMSGETTEYYRGFLLSDRIKSVSGLAAAEWRELNRVAELAQSAAARGTAYLVQRRYGPADYGYWIVAAGGMEQHHAQ